MCALRAHSTATYLDGSLIERVPAYAYLGVWIDKDVTFKKRIDDLVKKLRLKVGLLKKKKKILPFQEQLADDGSQLFCQFLNMVTPFTRMQQPLLLNIWTPPTIVPFSLLKVSVLILITASCIRMSAGPH